MLQFETLTTKLGGKLPPFLFPTQDGKQWARLATCWSVSLSQPFAFCIFFLYVACIWNILQIELFPLEPPPSFFDYIWEFRAGAIIMLLLIELHSIEDSIQGMDRISKWLWNGTTRTYTWFSLPCLIFIFPSCVIFCYLCFVISDSCSMGEKRWEALNAIVAPVRTLSSHFSALMLRFACHKIAFHNDKHFVWEDTLPRL